MEFCLRIGGVVSALQKHFDFTVLPVGSTIKEFIMKEPNRTEDTSVTPNVKYKSSVFSKLFSDPAVLRELYSAIEGIELPPDIPIDINTLSNALIKGKLNDVSFLLGGRLIVLIEHQSTINENMPFRMLEYITRSYRGIVNSFEMLQRKLVKIPRPEFIVLYNGADPYDEYKELKLSGAFKDTEGLKDACKTGISLELVVHVYNINHGHNREILERSKTLNSYSIFINKIREYGSEGYDLAESVKNAIEYCISNKILEDFLRRYGMEVKNILLDEYTYENAMLAERMAARLEGLEEGREEGRELGREQGREQGRKLGIEQGREQGREEVISLLQSGKSLDEIIREYTGSTKQGLG
jgi:hypothetical protein